ncbi:MAG: hypothetical protein ACLGXA_24055 [Acidobacteriota bacterium]
MNRNAGESAVDRLIALAQQRPARPGAAGSEEPTDLEPIPLGLPSVRELEQNPMWKALLQLRAFLPYVARLLEMSNPSQPSTAVTAELRSEVRQSVSALESSHRDLRLAVQDQTVEIKRIEETITKTREATERNAVEVTELAEDVRSMRSLMKTGIAIFVALFLALIGSVVFLIMRIKPLVH